jgi:hypothetical protein
MPEEEVTNGFALQGSSEEESAQGAVNVRLKL